MHPTHQIRFLLDAVQGAVEEHQIERCGEGLVELAQIPPHPGTVGQIAGQGLPLLQHLRVDVEAHRRAGSHQPGCRDREQPVAASHVQHRHAGAQPHLQQCVGRFGPQRTPPVPVGHRGVGAAALAILRGLEQLPELLGIHPAVGIAIDRGDQGVDFAVLLRSCQSQGLQTEVQLLRGDVARTIPIQEAEAILQPLAGIGDAIEAQQHGEFRRSEAGGLRVAGDARHQLLQLPRLDPAARALQQAGQLLQIDASVGVAVKATEQRRRGCLVCRGG